MSDPTLPQQNLLDLLLAGLQEFVVVLADSDGKFTTWNPGVRNCFGYEPEEFIGQPASILFTASDQAQGVPGMELREAAEKGRSCDTRWLAKKGGERVIVEGVTIGLREAGKLVGFGKVLRDVTAQVNSLQTANERLQAMAVELERSNNELQEFARIASHDLSAPITSTRWLADLLATRHKSTLTADAQKIVAQMITGLQSMADLVEGVLAHTRVGITSIGSRQAVASGDALQEAIQHLRKDIELSKAVVSQGDMPEVYIEPHALTQLFQNLLSNAIKYRRPGVPPDIHIGASALAGECTFIVRDNGIGIAPDWFERIFQPMQRGPVSQVSGSGIGLATCKKIVTRAGGAIWVDSKLNEGSTFFFTLPAPTGSAG